MPPVTTEITPYHIDTNGHFFEAFGNMETENSARWIVRFCQRRNDGWADFTYEQIDAFYRSKGRMDGFTFNRLIEDGYIIQAGDRYQISHRFIARCHQSRPRG